MSTIDEAIFTLWYSEAGVALEDVNEAHHKQASGCREPEKQVSTHMRTVYNCLKGTVSKGLMTTQITMFTSIFITEYYLPSNLENIKGRSCERFDLRNISNSFYFSPESSTGLNDISFPDMEW